MIAEATKQVPSNEVSDEKKLSDQRDCQEGQVVAAKAIKLDDPKHRTAEFDKSEEAQRITDLMGGKVRIEYCPEAREEDESFMSCGGPSQGHLYTLDFHPSTGLEMEGQQWVDDRGGDNLTEAVLYKLEDISCGYSDIYLNAQKLLQPELYDEDGKFLEEWKNNPVGVSSIDFSPILLTRYVVNYFEDGEYKETDCKHLEETKEMAEVGLRFYNHSYRNDGDYAEVQQVRVTIEPMPEVTAGKAFQSCQVMAGVVTSSESHLDVV